MASFPSQKYLPIRPPMHPGTTPEFRKLSLRRDTRRFALLILLPALCLPAGAQIELPADHPKHRTAQAVFDDLVRAIGDGRVAPRLRLLSGAAGGGSQQVAWLSPKQHQITIEERSYDLCLQLEADSLDALGFLLGHELAHFYKDHLWASDFGSRFVGPGTEQQPRDPHMLAEVETEADYFGGFFGHVAGYNTLAVAGDLLERIYAEYDLAEDQEGYPSLAARREIARRSREQLSRMVPIFEIGHRLLLLRRYEEAGRSFDFIARTFPSREILNNAGVARALEAVQLFPVGALRFAYPFELDARTRLRVGGKAYGGTVRDVDRRERLLREAGTLFESSREKDPSYVAAHVNLACVADLRNEPEDAEFWAGKAVRIAREQGESVSLANALIMRGIARVHGEPADEEGARRDFTAARTGNTALAQLNLAVLEGTAAVQAAAERRSSRPESIGGHEILDDEHIYDAPDLIVDLPRLGRDQPVINIYTRRTETWSGWIADTGYSSISLLETRPGYRGQTGRGIQISHSLSQVVDAYGDPAFIVAGRQGANHVYEHAGIAFRIGGENTVRGWMLFGTEE